ncbi:MAG: peptidoglycan recognition protein family protein [Chthoniobacterales bacterium]|nr:peptidoglycan recognition protein family protein [Chthoniobacterales bacterium]
MTHHCLKLGKFFLCLLLLSGGLVFAHAELTSAQKQALFLKTKKTTTGHATSKKHNSSSSPNHSSKKKKHPSHTASYSHHTVTPISSATTPTHHLTHSPAQHNIVIPMTPHTAQEKNTNAVITIEKSGILQEQAPEPTPTPPPSHGWSWLFGDHHSSYHYLSYSVRRAIDRAPVRHGRWKYIVVHNSGTRGGNARIFDIYHRRVRKMVNGLAYHFVIGNGVSSGNGEIEVGHRWSAQLNGGHVASDYLNDISLGICLVGDYNQTQPTKAQLGALNELIAYLRQRVGTTQGHHATVYAHKEINPRPTDCPGTHFPYAWLHHVFGRN